MQQNQYYFYKRLIPANSGIDSLPFLIGNEEPDLKCRKLLVAKVYQFFNSLSIYIRYLSRTECIATLENPMHMAGPTIRSPKDQPKLVVKPVCKKL